MEEEQNEALPIRNIGEKRARVSTSAPALSEEISQFSNQPTPSPTLNPTNRTSTEPNISFLDKYGQVVVMGSMAAMGVAMGRGLYTANRNVMRQIDRELMEERMTGAEFLHRDQESARMSGQNLGQENAARFAQESAQTPPPPVTVV